MIDPEGIEPAFLNAISNFVGTSEEFEFERHGIGDSTYTLHGKIVPLNRKYGTVQIRRTRTHEGEVHQMGLWLFLSATQRSGVKVRNRIADALNNAFREQQRAREAAVASISQNSSFKLDPINRRLRFVDKRQGLLDGFPAERYV